MGALYTCYVINTCYIIAMLFVNAVSACYKIVLIFVQQECIADFLSCFRQCGIQRKQATNQLIEIGFRTANYFS